MLLIRLTLRPRVPVLPLELKAAILAECDLPTLATASRVSQEFLALAGPALYRDIDIDGEPRLRRLVRSPVSLVDTWKFGPVTAADTRVNTGARLSFRRWRPTSRCARRGRSP